MATEMNGNGCKVTILGRSGLRYEEGTRKAFVDGEMLTGKYDFAVYTKSIGLWENDGRPISEEEKKNIVANISLVFQQNGLVGVFEE